MTSIDDRDTQSLNQAVSDLGLAMVIVGRRFSWLRKAEEGDHRPMDILIAAQRLADTASIAAYDLQAASRAWKAARADAELPFDHTLRARSADLRAAIGAIRARTGGLSAVMGNALRLLDAVNALENASGPREEIDPHFLARMDEAALHPVLSIHRIGFTHDDYWRGLREKGVPVSSVPTEVAGPVSTAVFIPPGKLDFTQVVKLGAMAANGLDIHLVDQDRTFGGATVPTKIGRIFPVPTPEDAVRDALGDLRDAAEGISPMSVRRIDRVLAALEAPEETPEPA